MYENNKNLNGKNYGRYSSISLLKENEKRELDIDDDALSYLKHSLNIPIEKFRTKPQFYSNEKRKISSS